LLFGASQSDVELVQSECNRRVIEYFFVDFEHSHWPVLCEREFQLVAGWHQFGRHWGDLL